METHMNLRRHWSGLGNSCRFTFGSASLMLQEGSMLLSESSFRARTDLSVSNPTIWCKIGFLPKEEIRHLRWRSLAYSEHSFSSEPFLDLSSSSDSSKRSIGINLSGSSNCAVQNEFLSGVVRRSRRGAEVWASLRSR